MGRERWDRVDLVWILIPAAVGLFALRTLLIARRLRLAAEGATAEDAGALQDAKASLGAHREVLQEAIAAPERHLAAAQELSRNPNFKTPHASGAAVTNAHPKNRI